MDMQSDASSSTGNKLRLPDVRRNMLFFFGRLVVLSALFLGLIQLLPKTFLELLARFNARLVELPLRAAGFTPVVHGNHLTLGFFSVKIIGECLALELVFLCVAFILSFPGKWKLRLQALALGVPVLLIANIFRLALILLVCSRFPNLFLYIHAYLGQIFLMGVLLIVCLGYMYCETGNKTIQVRGIFVLKLIVYSSVLLLGWSFIQNSYVFAMEKLLKVFGKVLLGYPMKFKSQEVYDYTFNFVSFLALMLASDSLTWKKKLKTIPMGLGILVIAHILFRVICLFSAGFKSPFAYKASIVFFRFSMYLLPILLWLFFRWYRRSPVLYACPLCGKFNRNPQKHIRRKHGTKALQDPKVIEFFNMIESAGSRGAFIVPEQLTESRDNPESPEKRI